MMTHREAMLLLIDKTDRATDALKRLRDIDNHPPMAERRAVNLIRIAIDEDSRLTKSDKQGLNELIHGSDPVQPEQRTETIRFRVTPNEKAALQLMADRCGGDHRPGHHDDHGRRHIRTCGRRRAGRRDRQYLWYERRIILG